MTVTERQAGNYLTATEVATNVSTTGGMNGLVDRSNVKQKTCPRFLHGVKIFDKV